MAASQPGVSARLLPDTVAFWDATRGLIGSGFRYCRIGRCAEGAISLTSDGGRTSRVLLRTAGPVSWVTAASGGFAWATIDRCSAARGCTPARSLRTRDGGRSWQPLQHVVVRPSFADGVHGIALSPQSCEIAACFHATLLVTADGGRTWSRLRGPCGGGGEQAVSLVTPSRAWVLCASQPGVGNQGKAMYRSTDGLRTWTRLLSVQIGGKPSGGISSYGYVHGISFAANGAGRLWEGRGTLYLTLDGGRRWASLPSVARPEIDFGDSASVVPGRAFALLDQANRVVRLVATTGGYARWHTVRTWHLR